MGSQIAEPRRCIGINTVSIVAPKPLNRSAASRTIASTCGIRL